MRGQEVYNVLRNINATHLHHANSVATSCTFLEQSGLLSRGFVERHGLIQTPQPASDDIDKKYGIWDCIFLDHVDIHARGGRRKAPNFYGPVLFVFDLSILLTLPEGTDIGVTKNNPVHWHDKQSANERWFSGPEELARVIRYGNFENMLVIQTPNGKLEFPNHVAHAILDDPQRQISSGEDAYVHAENRLRASANVGYINLSIMKRHCQNGCICLNKYARYSSQQVDFFFM